MSDKFFPIPLKQLLTAVLKELSHKGSFFGIPHELFYRYNSPETNPLGTRLFGRYLASPLGVAAGPHTQMAQNIVAAWLTGARYIELKTVQTLDELEVSKPCIDMQDEGYNCEWSQELKIKQSFYEYLKAWILIHILNHKMGWDPRHGTIFNMSAGYDLQGIQQDNMQWYFDKMHDCTLELKAAVDEIKPIYPGVEQINIPAQLSDNITLSTMHGCPAGEIESIASFLMEQRNLHTYIKLNPTLVGPERLRGILNKRMGYHTVVPDSAFGHDLRYRDALKMIRALSGVAERHSLEFGLKLTNTLETENHKAVFGPDIQVMYMSGRALHPVAINLAGMLQHDFNNELSLSFSAGLDAFNVVDTLRCGFKTVTVCSDLLKPGGYMRLHQYAGHLYAYAEAVGMEGGTWPGPAEYLHRYAHSVTDDARYMNTSLTQPDIKTKRKLGLFDCISAPCRDSCATGQDIPDYMYYASQGTFSEGLGAILRTNPFPRTTGMVCDHLCQNKCTRVHYDNSLLIREVKRFLAEWPDSVAGKAADGTLVLRPESPNGLEVSVIGAGPAGLSCAFFLALAGFSIDVYEMHSKAGGMARYAIPGFRLTDEAIESDLNRIAGLGVRIHYQTRVDAELFRALREKSHYVFVGAGAQLSAPLNIKGIDAEGVVDPITFLKRVKSGQPTGIGSQVLIIGGGNTAMDAARTVFRLVGENGKVTVVYRRTINEMPADQGEIKAVLEEGINIMELTGPEEIVAHNGRVTALKCFRMHLAGHDKSGRPSPVAIPGSEFELPCDTIIPAVGQALDLDFIQEEWLKTRAESSFQTQMDRVYTGGDSMRGASTAINAIGDGRKAAEEIMRNAFFDFRVPGPYGRQRHEKRELILKRAVRIFGPRPQEIPLSARRSFTLVQQALKKEKVMEEAARCLYCDEMCSTCATVCPNLANIACEVTPRLWYLQKAVRSQGRDASGNGVHIDYDKTFEVRQETQILNLANFCNECGNCETFCPATGAPYKIKPKIHLDRASFEGSASGYYLSLGEGRKNLIYKNNELVLTLCETADEYIFETPEAVACLDKDDFHIRNVQFLNENACEAGFEQAAQMAVIMEGLSSF